MEKLDWNNTIGLKYEMIADKNRNRWYDQALKKSVYNRDCIEIGFGSGILSFLAIKHGAKSVTAYESDFKVYQIGIELIKKLGLSNKIKLEFGNYPYDFLHQDDSHKLLFHEIMGSCLWNESPLIHILSLVKGSVQEILPARYGCDFAVYQINGPCPVDAVVGQDLLESYKNIKSDQWPEITNPKDFKKLKIDIQQELLHAENKFHEFVKEAVVVANGVGVDTEVEFVSTLLEVKKSSHQMKKYLQPIEINKYFHLIENSNRVPGYQIDVTNHAITINPPGQTLEKKDQYITCTIDLSHYQNNIAVVPIFWVEHNKDRLTLTRNNRDNYSHWGMSPGIFYIDTKKHKTANIETCLLNGQITLQI